jgi:hypothetical protein
MVEISEKPMSQISCPVCDAGVTEDASFPSLEVIMGIDAMYRSHV